MSVFLVLPSKRPIDEVNAILSAWRAQGYSIAIQRDPGDTISREVAEVIHYRPYAGYAEAVNFLAAFVLDKFKECDWICAAGDDTTPDPNKRADEIASECSWHFSLEAYKEGEPHVKARTFGVMQPTADRFAGGSIDRIAGSPWIGREFATRINQGRGPLWPKFWHMFADQCLQEVATKLGVFWQRPDLCHLHRHFMRESDALDSKAVRRPVPSFLVRANSPEEWQSGRAELNRLRLTGFAECMPQ